MDMVFLARTIVESRRTQDQVTGKMSDWVSGGGYFVMAPLEEEHLFSKINYNVTTFFLWNMTEKRNVWSVVFLSQAIEDPSSIIDARADLKDELVFSAYGSIKPGFRFPPLGAIAIQSKSALEKASERHPIFLKAYRLLVNCSDAKNWVGLIDIDNGTI